MKINDEGSSNAAHWHERAMKAEARLAEADALLREAREPLADIYYCEKQDCIACRIDAFLKETAP